MSSGPIQDNIMSILQTLLPAFFLLSISMTTSDAGEVKRKGPPSSYRLGDISVRFTLHPGSPAFSMKRLSLFAGRGEMLERDGTVVRFPLANQELLNLVNALYRMRFFELPSDYTAEYSVVQKEDGILATMISSMDDEPGTSVCVSIKEYKKCVAYGRKGPFELENLVERVFSKAND